MSHNVSMSERIFMAVSCGTKTRSTSVCLQAVYRDAGHLDDEAGRSAQQLRVILAELARLQAASAIERCV